MLRKKSLLAVLSLVLIFSVVWVASALSATTLRLGLRGGPEADAHLRLASIFEQETGIRVEIETIAKAAYFPKILPILASHTGDYDVIFVRNSDAEEWIEAGFLEPLDAYMKDPTLIDVKEYDLHDFIPQALNVYVHDGKLYGLPQHADAHFFYYRTDIFNQRGISAPPAQGYTWKVLWEIAKKLTKDTDGDGKIDVYGFLHAGNLTHGVFPFINAIWSYGGEIMTPEFEPTLNSPAAVEAAGMLVKAYRDGITPPGLIGWGWSEVLTAQQQGMSAMAMAWQSQASSLNDPQQSPITAGKMDWRPIPYLEQLGSDKPRVFPSTWAVSISADSQNKEAAFKYITWFTSKKIARDYVLYGGGTSGRKSLLLDIEVLRRNPQYLTLQASFSLYHELPPIKEKLYLFEELLPPSFNSALAGKGPVKDYLDRVNQELRQFLIDKEYLKG